MYHREELSYLANGCVFDVHGEVGPGVGKECYRKAMEYRLIQCEIPCVPKPKTSVEFRHRESVVGVFEPDVLLPEGMNMLPRQIRALKDE